MDLFSSLNPEADLRLSIIGVVIGLVVTAIYYWKTKRKLTSLKIFSVLSNISFILNGGDLFWYYHIGWFGLFTYYVWPVINVMLFVKKKILALFICSTALNVFFGWVFLDNPPYKLGLGSGVVWPLFNVALLGYLLYRRYGRKKAVTAK